MYTNSISLKELEVSPALSKRSSAAFSLIELLSAIAVMALMASLAIPALNREGSALKSGLTRTANLIQSAQQYAVAQNCYTYVLFSEPVSGSGVSYVAVVASKTGLDIAPFGTSVEVTENTDFEFIGRIESFDNINFLKELPKNSTIVAPEATPFNEGTATFKLTRPTKLANSTFTRMIKFTPRAEARVAASPLERLQIILQPTKAGTITTMEQQRASVVQLSGLTGKIKIYQP